MEAIVIEPFRGHNQQLIAEMIVEIQSGEFGIPIAAKDQPDLFSIDQFYQRGKGNFWVARDGENIVGSLALLDIGNDQGALRKMFVKSAYRGKEHSVALRLLESLIAWAEENGLKEVLLGTTAKFLAAHRFYEKNGFVEIQKTTLPANFPIMAVDSKFYRRQLR